MLCYKFPTFHSSKNTTEPKELTGKTISLIAFDSSYQGQIRGFEETLENKTAVEHMLQQELETLENEPNVVKETAIGELLETSNSSEEASLLCTFKTESTDTANKPLYLREQHENSDEKSLSKEDPRATRNSSKENSLWGSVRGRNEVFKERSELVLRATLNTDSISALRKRKKSRNYLSVLKA